MKQPQYQPLQVWEQAVILFAVNNGHFDAIPVPKALEAERALRDYLKLHHKALVDRLEATKDLPKDDENLLTEALKAFLASAAF
jgi:F-type H+-transporting ATPase subunit alpha